jgi:hypothetical protein
MGDPDPLRAGGQVFLNLALQLCGGVGGRNNLDGYVWGAYDKAAVLFIFLWILA